MKNNKLKKVLIIILVSLLALLGIFILVSFIVNKDGTLYWINYFVDLLNKPLPIVGVTTLAVLIFVWRLIVSTNYGQKVISGLRQELNSIKAEHEQYKIDSENEKAELKHLVTCLNNDGAGILYRITNLGIADTLLLHEVLELLLVLIAYLDNYTRVLCKQRLHYIAILADVV